MTTSGEIRLSGEHLATARRAVSVALFVGVAAADRHDVAELLPDPSDLTDLLSVLGWPGAAEPVAVLDAGRADVLERVVYATLILALEEGEKGAYRALRAPHRIADGDPAALVAVETLAGLALRLRYPGDPPSSDRVEPTPSGEALVSPALSALADGITLPVWIANADLTLEWINPAFAAVAGVEPASATGASWWRWCDPHDVPRVAQVVDAATLEHRNWSVEAGVGPLGGPYSRLLMVAAPRFAPHGAMIGWSGICFDVTRDARLSSRLEPMSLALTAHSAKAHLLLRQFPGMIWTTDTELRCTSIVGSGLATVGRIAGDCVGRPLADIAGPSGPTGPLLDAHTAALDGTSQFVVHVCCGRDFETHVEPLRDGRGAVFGAIGISHDITERVARDAENQRLVRQLELAQRIGRVGSWELDTRTGSFLWSDEGYRLLGYDPGAVEPSFEVFIERVHPQDRERLMAMFRERMRSGVGFQLDYRLVGTDGKLRTMRSAVEFEHDAVGDVVRVVGILQDVTTTDVVTGQSVDLSTLLGVRTRPPVPESRPV